MNLKIYIDGNFHDQAEAKISVFDHGLLYGDGVFEGIRFYNDRVFRLDEHIDRLWDSAQSDRPGYPNVEVGTGCRHPRDDSAERSSRRLYSSYRDSRRGIVGAQSGYLPPASIIIIAATIALYPEDLYHKGLTMVTCCDAANAAGRFEPAGQIAELPEQYPGKARSSERRRRRRPDAE